MDELCFRGRDRLRPGRLRLAVVGALVGIQSVAVAIGSGVDGVLVTLAVVFGVMAPVFWFVARSWTRVGPEGVTVRHGFGPGRLTPWEEVTGIEVREQSNNGGKFLTVRISRTGGRPRTLPGLSTSFLYPDPEFARKVEQLRAWRRFATGQGEPEPARRWWRRRRGVR